MKENRFYFSLILLLLFSYSVVSQEKKFLKYTVLKGETISQIAVKYKVTPYDIYKLNPDSQNGIRENDVIILPVTQVSEKIVVETAKPQTAYRASTHHVVKPKETFLGEITVIIFP
jgi:LysM repeat protein